MPVGAVFGVDAGAAVLSFQQRNRVFFCGRVGVFRFFCVNLHFL